MSRLKFDPKNNRWEANYSLTNVKDNWRAVWEWCWGMFGHPGTDPDSGVKSEWDYHGGSVYFYSEHSAMIFALRWD